MNNLKYLREINNITLDDLSRKSNVSKKLIEEIENDKDGNEDKKLLNELSKILEEMISEKQKRNKNRIEFKNKVENEYYNDIKNYKRSIYISGLIILIIVLGGYLTFNKINKILRTTQDVGELIESSIQLTKSEESFIVPAPIPINEEVIVAEPPVDVKKNLEAISKENNFNIYVLLSVLTLLLIALSIWLLNNGIKRKEKLIDKLDVEELTNRLDEDFINNLIKINIHQINAYNNQTKSQANKSFIIAVITSIVGFVITCTGIWYVLSDRTNVDGGYFTSIIGVLIQFISGVIFYLYNKTVAEMSEYHKKLILIQNIGLALKSSETFEETKKTEAREKIIEELLKNLNQHLVEKENV